MKITKKMLQKFVTVHENLYETMNKHIIEIDEKAALVNATNLVVGHVLSCVPHPDSDHLNVTTVDLGTHIEQIVCGASNIRKDQYVIVAKVGAVLPGDFKIKEAKIRGIESKGMICSLRELGFDDALIDEKYKEGIFYFDTPVTIGEDPLKYFGLEGDILTLGLTPNRGDLLSILGIAYDYAAMTNQKVLLEQIDIKETKNQNPLEITIETSKCLEYNARFIEHVTIKESPNWLKQFLILHDIKPINNVVDITNYVLINYGTPLHAFDADLFKTKRIVIKEAKHSEKIITLDEVERYTKKGDILITNSEEVVALGGVMGLLNTAIKPETKSVILEAALFNQTQIAKSSKAHQLRSDSSLRFERGIDQSRVLVGLEVATKLLIDLADAKVSLGIMSSVKKKVKPVLIETKLKTVNQRLGLRLTNEDLEHIFTSYNYTYKRKKEIYVLTPPSYRLDLKIEADILEEVVRYYGMDEVSGKALKVVTKGHLTEPQKLRRTIRHFLAHQGLNEVVNYSLLSANEAVDYEKIGETVTILKPLSEDRKALRQSLINGLVKVTSYNQARQNKDVAIFEIGHVFAKDIETDKLAVLISGETLKLGWNKQTKPVDFYVIKGLLENLLDTLKVDYEFRMITKENLHPYQTAAIYINNLYSGFIGQIHPKQALKLDIEKSFVFELNLEHLTLPSINYEVVSKYPTVQRDLAFVISDDILVGDVLKLIKQTARKQIQSLEVFDIYQGEQIGANLKSVAVSIFLNDKEKTLTSEEVDKLLKKISNRLVFEYKAVIRD